MNYKSNPLWCVFIEQKIESAENDLRDKMMNVSLSEEIKRIISSNMTIILNNTRPEKREETDELLKSIMLEISTTLDQVINKAKETENAINELIEKMKKNNQVF